MSSLYRPKNNGKEQSIWWLRLSDRGRRWRESSGTADRDEALRKLKIREGEIAQGIASARNPGNVRFKELATDLERDYELNHRKTLKDLKHRHEKYLLPFFGQMRVCEFTGADIQRFIQWRMHAKKKPTAAEVNRELAHLRTALSLGVRNDKVINPVKFHLLKENNTRVGFFTDGEVATLLSHLPIELQGVIEFAYHTGWRVNSEVLTLRWKNVTAEGVTLDPGTTKNGEGRFFPMNNTIARILSSARNPLYQLCPWVFHREGKRIRYFRRSWITACKLSGLASRLPHDLRRSAVRNMLQSGVSEVIAMKLTGHLSRSIFDRYSIFTLTDITEAAQKIDRRVSKKEVK